MHGGDPDLFGPSLPAVAADLAMAVQLSVATVFIVAVGLTAACSDTPAFEDEGFVVRDSAGIEIVESTSPVWSAARSVEAEPVLRIGREEEGPYQFAVVGQALFLQDGSIAIAEGRAQEVRVFGPDGSHEQTLGRRGEGPGEFMGLSWVLEYSEDSIAAYDWSLRRTTVFHRPSGRSRNVVHQLEGNFAVFGRTWDGPFLLYSPGSGYRPDLPPGLQWVFTDIVTVDPADGSPRVIGQLPQREQLVEPDGNTGRVIPGRYAIQAVAHDGFYWATPDRYEIDFFDVDGVKRRQIRRPVEPPPVRQDEIDAYIEAELERVRRFEGEDAVPRYRRSLEEASYGESAPLFAVAFVDGDHRLWVSGPAWPDFQAPPSSWSVFSEAGVWLGDVAAPPGLMLFDSRGDEVLGVWRDDFGVPYVQVHRLR